MNKNQEIGKEGELLAVSYLINQGYYILEQNFSCKLGEIDIIAIDKISENDLVFIEVKTRKQNIYGTPAEAVNIRKCQHIYNTAEYFLMLNNLENTCTRFDIIEILDKGNSNFAIHHIKNAILDNNNYLKCSEP